MIQTAIKVHVERSNLMSGNKDNKKETLVPVKKENEELSRIEENKKAETDTAKKNDKETVKSGVIIAAMILVIIVVFLVIIFLPKCQPGDDGNKSASGDAQIPVSDVQAGESGTVLSIRTSAESYVAGDTIVFTAAIENRSLSYVSLKAPSSGGAIEDVLRLKVTADGYAVKQANASAPAVSASDCYYKLAPGDSISKVVVYNCTADVSGAQADLWTCDLTATLEVDIGPSFVKRQTGLENFVYETYTDTETVGYYGVGTKPAA